MNRSGIECGDELGEVVGEGCDAKVLSLIRPRFGSEISLGVGNEPIPLDDLLSHRFPNTKVRRRSVDENDWFARALLDVFQANPIDLNLFGSLTPGYHRLLPLSLPYSPAFCCVSAWIYITRIAERHDNVGCGSKGEIP